MEAKFTFFGSWAAGNAQPSSDVDIGILSAVPIPPGLLSQLRFDLEESSLLLRVDVIDLSQTKDSFQQRVLSGGCYGSTPRTNNRSNSSVIHTEGTCWQDSGFKNRTGCRHPIGLNMPAKRCGRRAKSICRNMKDWILDRQGGHPGLSAYPSIQGIRGPVNHEHDR